MVHKNSLTWVVLFGVILLMFLQLPPMAAKQDSVVQTYSALVEVDALAKQQFVDVIDDDRLVDGAIRGMMLQLDPYSGYISADELPAFERRSRGDFSGVGAELGIVGGEIAIIAPLEGSPAARAGVLPGDVLLTIDGRSLKGRSVFDVEEMLVGPPGSRVTITVRHPGQTTSTELTVFRGAVHINSVRGFRRNENGDWDFLLHPPPRHERGEATPIGYIRVSNFRENTLGDFDAALHEVLDRGARALILDLRFNPGGLMQQAIAMADRFLDAGLIVSTTTRHRAVDGYNAMREGTVSNIQLVILINGHSASAAEIVAGSLQARGRASVVGERSFGKGSVQHLVHLRGHKAAVKLTVAYYRLPDGRTIHRTEKNAASDAWGVIPDHEVRLTEEETEVLLAARRALDNPLSPIPSREGRGEGTSQPSLFTTGDSRGSTGGPAKTHDLPLDRQLLEALKLAAGAAD
jgi:carboxyl-terminal processing protease